jgi:hypothetical protein
MQLVMLQNNVCKDLTGLVPLPATVAVGGDPTSPPMPPPTDSPTSPPMPPPTDSPTSPPPPPPTDSPTSPTFPPGGVNGGTSPGAIVIPGPAGSADPATLAKFAAWETKCSDPATASTARLLA